MKTKIEYGMEGAFKVDLYSGKKLVDTTDWFNNFITATGLTYPSRYAFVDCFRYLSLGYSIGGNTPNYGWTKEDKTSHTTGLSIGNNVVSYLVTSGEGTLPTSQRGQYIGWEGYEVGNSTSQSPCGTLLLPGGFSYFRAWSIPSGADDVVMGENLVLGEFMVSPSTGNSSGQWAFSRITRQLSIPIGWRAIVNYQLKVRVQNTGITQFQQGTFYTGNADISNDKPLVASWGLLSGYYRQVYPGLMCIDRNGNSFIPRLGAIMEPYLSNLNEATFYLSPDNAEFDVNPLNGNFQTDTTKAYQSDGLMGLVALHPGVNDFTWEGPLGFSSYTYAQKYNYYNQANTDTAKKTSEIPIDTIDLPINIRLGTSNAVHPLNTPSVRDYSTSNLSNMKDISYQELASTIDDQEISYATPGFTGINLSEPIMGQKAIFSTRITKLPFNNATGRTKTQTRKTMFPPVSSLGTNTRFGSLVHAYNSSTILPFPDKIFYPTVDTLFFDSLGRSTMAHYRLITDIFLTERGKGVANANVTLTIDNTGSRYDFGQRIYHRKTFQGPYNASYSDHGNIDLTHPAYLGPLSEFPEQFGGYEFTGVPVDASVGGSTSTFVTQGQTCSGYGAVYGICVDNAFYRAPYDCGLIEHSAVNNDGNRAPLTEPTNSAPLYWPSFKAGNQIKVSITGIWFSTNGSTIYPDFGNLSAGTLAASGFIRPTGYVYHVENVGTSGYRLLPNHAYPNNSGIDTYHLPDQMTGGYYPGLSVDNGLELYFDISWSADCGTALNCNPTQHT